MNERHECDEIRGKAQSVEKKSQYIGGRGPMVWHLVVPMICDTGILIISYCPFCGKKLE